MIKKNKFFSVKFDKRYCLMSHYISLNSKDLGFNFLKNLNLSISGWFDAYDWDVRLFVVCVICIGLFPFLSGAIFGEEFKFYVVVIPGIYFRFFF